MSVFRYAEGSEPKEDKKKEEGSRPTEAESADGDEGIGSVKTGQSESFESSKAQSTVQSRVR
jgi:hypothetical protein